MPEKSPAICAACTFKICYTESTKNIVLPVWGRWAGSFSEDRPLGWDPVAEGNRAGDGMARLVSEEKATDTLVCGKVLESKTGGVLHEDHVFGREP